MKTAFIITLCLVATVSSAQTLKSVLSQQLKSTHDKENWFVPIAAALDGVTAEQAVWTDGSGNHSIGQLANHLLFWNERQLISLKVRNLNHSMGTTRKRSMPSRKRNGRKP